MGTVDLARPADIGPIPNAEALQQSLRDCLTKYEPLLREQASYLLPADMIPADLTDADLAEAALAALVRQRVLRHLEAEWQAAAGAAFCASLDRSAWPGGAPWTRNPKPGAPDFWRIHSIALDNLPELLASLLPYGGYTVNDGGFTVWRGQHQDRPEPVEVDVLCGGWSEPRTGCGGADLVSFVGHVTGQGQGQAARWLSRFFSVPAVRYG